MGTLNINVLGTSFKIQAKEDDRYLEELLARYKAAAAYVEQSAHLKDSLKIAVMAGITLCDEIAKLQQKTTGAERTEYSGNGSVDDSVERSKKTEELFEAERITLQMIENLDKALS